MPTAAPSLVKHAIFPVAGLGTRSLPATKAIPKEMLTIVDKPLVQYAVEEAYEAGVRHMVFVTGRHKRAIADHFDRTFELEDALEKAQKTDLLNAVRAIKPDDMDCIFVRQPQPLGLGHAVLCGRSVVGEQAFAVLLPDDLMIGTPGIMAQMVGRYAERRASIVAVQEVPAEQTRRYGIVAGTPAGDRMLKMQSIVEKPAPELAPSRLAVAGRYVLTPAIWGKLAGQKRGVGGEIQLTDAIAALIADEAVYAYAYEGRRYDCGSKEGFLQANVELGLADPELGPAFRTYLRSLEL
ncbi:MAG: UTP--glucose-1-phosphate uridylyltransferase GalU [Pseudomonadota bacterium]|nr:UTP--glucose-1-phosphate uridylyltransferase GalU [Pseudomonadota bacterium]